jgi:hypothetical protein
VALSDTEFLRAATGAGGGRGMMWAASRVWRRVGSEGRGVVVASRRWLHKQW